MAKGAVEEGFEASQEEAGLPRVYELGFHLDPELPTEEARKAYQEIRAVAAKQGEIIAEGEPEKIPLAYTISRQDTDGRRDFDSAYFCWVAYDASAEGHEEVVSTAGGDRRIIRFIDLLTTREGARHAAEMREMAARTQEPAKASEDADTELEAALESAAV